MPRASLRSLPVEKVAWSIRSSVRTKKSHWVAEGLLDAKCADSEANRPAPR